MRLIHTEPLSVVRARLIAEDEQVYNISHAHVVCTKTAGDAVTTHALSGELYASKSGWILLDVPNALVRGAFDALNEPGVELPKQSNGTLNAHISVMRPEEIKQIGGIDKITERGHHFHYTLGPIQEVQPAGWDGISKVWFIQVKSKELQDLRKSYGLPPKPHDDEFDFHITIGTRRKKVLQNNDVAKAAEAAADMNGWEIKDSPIDGKGLFARRPYKPGDVIDHMAMTRNPNAGNSYEQSDASRFTNHSNDPNLGLAPHKTGVAAVAIKDIPAGAEITGDYNTLLPLLGDDLTFTYKGQPYNGESTSGKGAEAVNASEQKTAMWPLSSLAGTAIDVSGVKSMLGIGKRKPEAPVDAEDELADELMADKSHIDAVRGLPVEVPTPKRRKRLPVGLPAPDPTTSLISKQGDNNACLSWLPSQCTENSTDRTASIGATEGACTGTTSPTSPPECESKTASTAACNSTSLLPWEEACSCGATAAIASYYERDSTDTTGGPGDRRSPEKRAGHTIDAAGCLAFDDIVRHIDNDCPVIIKDGEYYRVATGYDGDTLFLGDVHEQRATQAVDGTTTTKRAWTSFTLQRQSGTPSPGRLLQSNDGRHHDRTENSIKLSTAGQRVRLLLSEAVGGVLRSRSVLDTAWLRDQDSGVREGEGREKGSADQGLVTRGLDSVDDEDEKKKRENKLMTIGAPVGGAGLLAALLHKPTSTLVPAQVTRFPGSDAARVIRGGIYHGAPASVFEDTGGGYMAVGPSQHGAPRYGFPMIPFSRTHAAIDSPASLASVLRNQQRASNPLEVLELHGHGTPQLQVLGDSPDIQSTLNAETVGDVARGINAVPHTQNGTIYNYGCATGLCAPRQPANDWQQQLANLTGMTSLGGRGYVDVTHGTGLDARVRASWPGLPALRNDPAQRHGASEDDAWTRYTPDQPQTIVRGPQADKHTYGSLPAGRLHELLYNIGKPSALIGALNPLLDDERTAKRTAIISSLLASPMVASEMAIRAQEARADQDLHGTGALQSHLSSQAKMLPHLALAALPLLSYGGAKLLGRWRR